jgi:hypothetical protein
MLTRTSGFSHTQRFASVYKINFSVDGEALGKKFPGDEFITPNIKSQLAQFATQHLYINHQINSAAFYMPKSVEDVYFQTHSTEKALEENQKLRRGLPATHQIEGSHYYLITDDEKSLDADAIFQIESELTPNKSFKVLDYIQPRVEPDKAVELRVRDLKYRAAAAFPSEYVDMNQPLDPAALPKRVNAKIPPGKFNPFKGNQAGLDLEVNLNIAGQDMGNFGLHIPDAVLR